MKGRKRAIMMAGAISVAAVGLTACGSKTAAPTSVSSSSKPLIYVIGYQTNNPFWDTEGKGAIAAEKTFGVRVRYEAPSTASSHGMINLIQAALGAHPAGIAINYTGKIMESSVLTALHNGVKVVLYNNDRFGPQNGGATKNPSVTNLAFVGQNEHKSGGILATHFLKYLPSSGGNILIVNPFPQAFVLTLRYNGVKSVLNAHGYKTHLLLATGNETSNYHLIGAYLTAHPDIVGILGLGDPATNPAAQYVSAHHLNIPLATFDMSPHTYQLLRKVRQYKVALDQQPYLQAYMAVEDLALNIKYGFQPVKVNTGTFVITKKNVSLLGRLVKAGLD